MKTTKIQIKSLWGSILFECEEEGNTIKDTLVKAVNKGASLWKADLRGADLWGADLWKADLRGADLRGADLRGADLREADLREADLWKADLRGANLWKADFWEADLQKLAAYNCIIPAGELVVWKKLQDGLIAKLRIPAEAKRVNAIDSRKCRFEFAEVIEIYNGSKKVEKGVSSRSNDFVYKVGEIIRPDSFDDFPLIECSHGIHAFITRIEAEEY